MQNLLSIGLQGYGLMTPHVPEFNPPVPEAVFQASGTAILESFQMLDLMARTNDLPSLFSFCDMRPVPGGTSKWLNKLETMSAADVLEKMNAAFLKAHGPWEEWFPIEAGLRSIDGLVTILERDGWRPVEEIIRAQWSGKLSEKCPIAPVPAKDVVAELKALAKCLRVGATHGAQFRLTHRNA